MTRKDPGKEPGFYDINLSVLELRNKDKAPNMAKQLARSKINSLNQEDPTPDYISTDKTKFT